MKKSAAHKHAVHAVAVDPSTKDANLKRLRRIEGQVRGIQRMIDEERYCTDIVTQISSIENALRAVSRELVRNHLRHCASHALRSPGKNADAMIEELVSVLVRA